ncbi:hypothetical protein T02_16 [Trichinella nativa]|uniref:Uncharacterized protein n=3 Tax=Trichinella TaxID=6333 RepID=A0A0V1LD19_9BILA|nr:hypothetical protein T05_4926 [Trichinella murrelli]KRX60814.1 hypothetical protein T09_13533 [Trichinella sp. T9]KRY14049.1 hypothetical protein T12_15634 [Trichinella patagoniensis]KRZ57154.1 hypothetical protein T02_16 [Trichinella nativa]KRZ90269.1 hypothetical protein T08_3411 [Trichinella sp. T8]
MYNFHDNVGYYGSRPVPRDVHFKLILFYSNYLGGGRCAAGSQSMLIDSKRLSMFKMITTVQFYWMLIDYAISHRGSTV